jgi:hypothetical protein
MAWNPSATELTTGATDALLGLLCLTILIRLLRMRVDALWKRRIWSWVIGLLGLASALGAAAHGLDLSDRVSSLLWLPLYLSLGVMVALFFVAALYDWRGEPAARAMLPWAILTAIGFFVLTQLGSGAFLVFVLYEAVAMIAALVIYVSLARTHRLQGAGIVAAGIAISIVAAAVQASALGFRLLVPLDHNGLFHVIQLVATMVLAGGVRAGLETRASGSRGSL